MEHNDRKSKSLSRKCEVYRCQGCGRGLHESCELTAEWPHLSCRRRAQSFSMRCINCQRGPVEGRCIENGNGNERSAEFKGPPTPVGSEVECHEVGDELACSNPHHEWYNIPLGMLNGFPAGLVAFVPLVGCSILFGFTFTRSRRHCDAETYPAPVGVATFPQSYAGSVPGVPIGAGSGNSGMVMGTPVQGYTAPAADRMLTVQVPPDYRPGRALSIETPTGTMTVVPPGGARPGSTFEVQY